MNASVTNINMYGAWFRSHAVHSHMHAVHSHMHAALFHSHAVLFHTQAAQFIIHAAQKKSPAGFFRRQGMVIYGFSSFIA